MKVRNILQNTGYPIHQNTCEVSSKSFQRYSQETCERKSFRVWPGERTLGETVRWMLTLCDACYTMKEPPDIKWPGNYLEIFPWTFIWHKWGLNTLSRYGDRAPETLPKITSIAIAVQDRIHYSVFCNYWPQSYLILLESHAMSHKWVCTDILKTF